MSRFLSKEAERLAPYTPGEQPREKMCLKLNTNESPFPPSPNVMEAITRRELARLKLYPDPACTVLHEAIAKRYGFNVNQVIAGNGSDEILAFAFRAFCGAGKGIAYADITYGFYQAQAALFGLEATVIPLREDFRLCIQDYLDFPGTIVIANPNAPTGIALPPSEITRLLEANPDRVVIVDEAYVDFGGESCVSLLADYDNLLVVQTMSKSRQLAGARVGFAMGSEDLISALNRVKYSWNPYNVNRLSQLAGVAAMEDEAYFQQCCNAIVDNRDWFTKQLEALGFTVLPSKANFVFAKSNQMPGEQLYQRFREKGVLVRWFSDPRIQDYVRITIGSREQMERLVVKLKKMMKEASDQI